MTLLSSEVLTAGVTLVSPCEEAEAVLLCGFVLKFGFGSTPLRESAATEAIALCLVIGLLEGT